MNPADEALLRTLVDLTWGEAFEDESVPSTAIQTKLIERAIAAQAASLGMIPVSEALRTDEEAAP